MENNEDFLNIVNKSGFLFQDRVEKEIDAAKPGSWMPIAHEHRWVDPLDGNEGYIDLILEYGIERMVIECKKVSDAKWIFLVPSHQTKTNRAKLLWTYEGLIRSETYRKKLSVWHNFRTKLDSLEALFCIVRGQGENDNPMLERLSSHLLRSVENLANEELEYQKRSEGEFHIYYPVIITNAKLLVCYYDSNDIEISTGQLAKANFEEVSSIRFRKNLSSSVQPKEILHLKQANSDYERTVFIINSNHIIDVLSQMKLPYEINAPWPWEGFK
ncbi:MAG: hypothetical protein JNK81_02255 [Anaerolineales bacterium]|nr:hypothetical protein [Anaerolineales bacterium]